MLLSTIISHFYSLLVFLYFNYYNYQIILINTDTNTDIYTILSPIIKPNILAAWKTKKPDHLKLYRECMRVFCAMEDGTAFRNGFKWDENIRDE